MNEQLPVILNLGCGIRTSPRAVNIDWSPYLRLHRSRVGSLLASLVLRGERLENFRKITGNVVVHDLRAGIPASDSTADAVYHSHVLEHIDRDKVPAFMAEVHRVLRPGGIHRIAVPNFGRQAREYLSSLDQELPNHDDMLIPLLGQSVRREAYGSSVQTPLRRRIERLILGDARRRGETHQWGYDEVNLRQILEANGFVDFHVAEPNKSSIPGWADTGLEVDRDGSVHKSGSLWVEARKPESPALRH